MTLRALRTVLLIPLIATACSGGDSAGPEDDDAVGTFELVEVNGGPLPHTYNPPPVVLQITEGSMRLMADGSFEEQVAFRLEDTGTGESFDETEVHHGTWTRAGGGLRLSTEEAGLSYTTASLVGDTLRYTVTGIFSFDLALERRE